MPSILARPPCFSRLHSRAQDTDRSGTIGFNEFSGLWKYIKDWQNVYRHFDRDRSGSIDTNELSEALRQFGYNLSPQLLRLVEAKYGESLSRLPPSPFRVSLVCRATADRSPRSGQTSTKAPARAQATARPPQGSRSTASCARAS